MPTGVVVLTLIRRGPMAVLRDSRAVERWQRPGNRVLRGGQRPLAKRLTAREDKATDSHRWQWEGRPGRRRRRSRHPFIRTLLVAVLSLGVVVGARARDLRIPDRHRDAAILKPSCDRP